MATTPATQEHHHTLYAEQLFNINGFPITNSVFTGGIATILLIFLAFTLNIKMKRVPGMLQSIFEVLWEQWLELCDMVTNNRKLSLQALPIVLSIFLFVLLNNWLGILPIVGSITFDTGSSNIQLFRGATADLNFTIAVALFSVLFSNISGAIAIGFWSHISKFLAVGELLKLKTVLRNPVQLVMVPVNIFVGLLELLGEIAKVASLSLRLFGNVFAGEVLLASMAGLIAYFIPAPFVFFEFFVGIIQALILSLLTLVYITLAHMSHGDHEEHHKPTVHHAKTV